MDTQVRTAKAVIGIDEVHFYKHTSGEPEINDTLLAATTGWFSSATLKGSVEVAQDELSKTMIHIDQSSAPIGISTEAGDFNINFTLPSLITSELEKWLKNKSTNKLTIGSQEGYGFDLTEELGSMVVALKAKTGEWLIFPNVQGAVTLGKVDDEVWALQYSGAVVTPNNVANKVVYILSDKVVSTSGEV